MSSLYRPIACLNTAYKAYTGTLAIMLTQHVEAKRILPAEQKALRKGRRGCLDALVVDAAVAGETKLRRRDLSMGWVDYKKAFDMVPHPWLKQVLKAIRTPREVRKPIGRLIPLWKTIITVSTDEGLRTIPINLKRGVFQGDSLSPLLFCLSVAPLSHEELDSGVISKQGQ